MSDFVIKKREVHFTSELDKYRGSGEMTVLTQYLGKGGDVVVPEGVTYIGENAFSRSKLTSIVLPESVRIIGYRAFRECHNLRKIIIPEGVKDLESTFVGCKRLEHVVLPASLLKLWPYTGDGGVFYNCNSLKVIEMNGCKAQLAKDVFGDELPTGLRTQILDLAKHMTDGAIKQYVLNSETWNALKPDQQTELFLACHSSSLISEYKKLLSRKQKQVETIGNKIEEQLKSKTRSSKDCDFAAVYMTMFSKQLSEETLERLFALLQNDSKANKALKVINEDPVLKKKFADRLSLAEPPKKTEKLFDENDPYLAWRKEFNEAIMDKSIKSKKGSLELFDSIRMNNSEEYAPAFIVKCAVVPYLDLYTGRPKHIGGYETDYIDVKIIKKADEAAALLNISDLRILLEKQYEQGGPAWLLPFGRYASGSQITSLISNMKKWSDWYLYSSSGRSDIITARGALMLSDTREAIINLDKTGVLKDYAKMRKMDEDYIRDVVLADFGLNPSGKKEYDLGSKIIVVSLLHDFVFEIFDTAENKVVKSIPKKGVDAELYEAATADFSDIKKNVKKIVKSRNEQLFSDFLTGRTVKADKWISIYTKNPLLRYVAELLVWNQGKNTFTLSETGIIDCCENEYKIDVTKPIGVAHPIEMQKTEIKAWQGYFTSHALKQPFAQVWEPAIEKASIMGDRYKGCKIPYFSFRNQEKHGIHVFDYDFHNQIEIRFDDCLASVNRVEWNRHQIDNNDEFEIVAFGFQRYTRKVNHIVAYFDRITILGRILNDDTTISTELDKDIFTVAQIMEFIRYAQKNGSNQCLAMLMDYKNKKFADYDPMDEFVLE